MISIIISSGRPSFLKRAKLNIQDTIGIPFELLVYPNYKGDHGLCEIYNQGAREAKYEILCYMHEDLDIRTPNWGQIVLDIFHANQKLGVLGVAGSSYKSFAPSAWAAVTPNRELMYCNYIQQFPGKSQPDKWYRHNIAATSTAEVVCVDGMWFCTPKHIALTHPFDESSFSGFHCYDQDYCLGIFGKYQSFVTFDVLIAHASEGNYGRDWIEDTLRLHEKWAEKLPFSIESINKKARQQVEKNAYKFFIERLAASGYPQTAAETLLAQHRASGKISFFLYLKLRYYVYKFFAKTPSKDSPYPLMNSLTFAASGFGALPKGKRK